MSESTRWGTPADVVDMSRHALGGLIELDPMSEAAFQSTIQATRFWTEQDDAFAQPHWRCDAMLINPPGGLVVPAWRRLVAEVTAGNVRSAIWIGFSVEQLCIMADEACHPMDFSLLICRERINFLTTFPKRKIVSETMFECGHAVRSAPHPKMVRGQKMARCHECSCDPEPAGSPSHGNYVCALGVMPSIFEMAFAGQGRFSHGKLVAADDDFGFGAAV